MHCPLVAATPSLTAVRSHPAENRCQAQCMATSTIPRFQAHKRKPRAAVMRRGSPSRMHLRDCQVRSSPMLREAFAMLDAGEVVLIAPVDKRS